MSYTSDSVVAAFCAGAGAVAFGAWQGSIIASLFMLFTFIFIGSWANDISQSIKRKAGAR